MALAQLSIDIVAQLAKFEEDMRRAADSTKDFRDQVTTQLDGLRSMTASYAMGIAGGMAAAFSVGAVRDWINHHVEAADELNRLSQQTGVSVEALSAWGNIAKRNGQDVSDLSELIQELSLKLIETDTDSEGAGLALKQLGLDYRALSQLSSEDAFKQVAQAVSGIEDSGKKTALVMAIMGDEAQKYITALNAIGASSELVPTVLTEQSKAATRYRDSLAELQKATDAWSQSVISGMTPVLADLNVALSDVIMGTSKVSDKADDLGRSTAIREWVEGCVKLLTYLSDVLQVVGRAVFVTLSTIDTAIKSVAIPIAGAFKAAAAAMTGDFEGATQAINTAISETDQRTKQWTVDVSSAFSDELFGSAVRSRMEEVKKLGEATKESGDAAKKAGEDAKKAGEDAKRSAKNFTLVKQGTEDKKKSSEEKKRADEARRAMEQYATLVTSIRTKTAADEAEAAGLAPLTEAQRAALEVMTQIRDNRLKLSDEQKRTIVQYLEEASAASEAAAAARLQADWLRESGEARVQALEQGAARIDDLRKQIQAEADQVAQWGLSAEALAGLQRARQLETAAALESRAAAMAGLDSHAALVAQWNEQADAIRELVELQRQQAEQQRKAAEDPYLGAKRGVQAYMDELKRAGDAAEQFASQSLRGVEDALTDLATTGKADWKGLVNSMLAEALRLQVIRPMMSSLLGGGSSGGSGAAGGVIGLLGNLAGGKSGGGVDSFNSWEVDAGLSSGGGGSWFSSAASMLGNLFGRANGGPVQSGQLYNVNERGPELLTVGNRTMLMMGHDSGVVTPLQSPASVAGGGAGGGTVTIYQTFNFGAADAVTREDLRRTAAEAKSAALAEFANFRARGVRGYT